MPAKQSPHNPNLRSIICRGELPAIRNCMRKSSALDHQQSWWRVPHSKIYKWVRSFCWWIIVLVLPDYGEIYLHFSNNGTKQESMRNKGGGNTNNHWTALDGTTWHASINNNSAVKKSWQQTTEYQAHQAAETHYYQTYYTSAFHFLCHSILSPSFWSIATRHPSWIIIMHYHTMRMAPSL